MEEIAQIILAVGAAAALALAVPASCTAYQAKKVNEAVKNGATDCQVAMITSVGTGNKVNCRGAEK